MSNILIVKCPGFLAVPANKAGGMLEALAEAVSVNHEGYYDPDKDYIIQPNETIEFAIVHESRVKMLEKENES